MIDSKENYKFDLGVKGLRVKGLLNIKLIEVPHKCKHEPSWFMFGCIEHKLSALVKW